MKLLLENWRKFVTEDHGVHTTWDNVHVDDVFKITGKSCEEGRECIPYTTAKLESKLKNKPIRGKGIDPKRVKTADINTPLIVVVDNGEYQYIMDGNHRFARAEQKDKIVQVKELYMDEYNQLFGGAG